MLPTFCPPTIWTISLEFCGKPSILAADDFLGACKRKAMTPKSYGLYSYKGWNPIGGGVANRGYGGETGLKSGQIRRDFVRKVYGTVSLQLAATALMAKPICTASDAWLSKNRHWIFFSAVLTFAVLAFGACSRGPGRGKPHLLSEVIQEPLPLKPGVLVKQIGPFSKTPNGFTRKPWKNEETSVLENPFSRFAKTTDCFC